MTPAPQSPAARLQELERLGRQLATDPSNLEFAQQRARLLAELGRHEEAKQAYFEILAVDPAHRVALNGLGELFLAMGHRSAAQTAFTEAVKHHPEDPVSHVKLASVLSGQGEAAAAREHYETALRLDPHARIAHEGLVYILSDLGEKEAADEHRRLAFSRNPISVFGFHGKGEPIPLLVLVAGDGGDIPFHQLIDFRTFLITTLAIEFLEPGAPLPPHALIFNSIGDADLSRVSLEAAARVLAGIDSPVINSPEVVLATGRDANAERLGLLPGVVTPKIAILSRELLSGPDAAVNLAALGFAFPLLLRSPGFHAGRHFVQVENREALAAALPSLPGPQLTVLQFLDVRGADGKIRKYRVMMIGGKLYPLHAAVSHDWKVHYFSADMVDSPEHRAEDQAFLENMPEVLGEKAMSALQAVQAELGLDYAGIDFSLGKDGEVILFEANATMTIVRPPQGEMWDYRRQPVRTILDAIRELFFRRAKFGQR